MAIVKRPNRSQADIASEKAAESFITGAERPSTKRERKIPILVRFDPHILVRVDEAVTQGDQPQRLDSLHGQQCLGAGTTVIIAPAPCCGGPFSSRRRLDSWHGWRRNCLLRADPALTRPTHSISSLQWSAEAREQPVCLLSLLSL